MAKTALTTCQIVQPHVKLEEEEAGAKEARRRTKVATWLNHTSSNLSSCLAFNKPYCRLLFDFHSCNLVLLTVASS
jgi:hypothetical protein